jgi:hypothetical protein
MRAITASSSSSCAADGIARSASIQSVAVGAKPLRMCWEKKLRKTCQKKAAANKYRNKKTAQLYRRVTHNSPKTHFLQDDVYSVFQFKKMGKPQVKE